MVLRTCEYCGTEFETYACFVRDGGGRFCSRPCFFKSDVFKNRKRKPRSETTRTRTVRPRFANVADRLWSRVDKDGECWNWTGYVTSDGYGRMGYDGRVEGCHRVAYQLVVGPIPEGMCVCHRCDNRRCVNPSHLFLGTNLDNMVDKTNKERQARGETHPRAILTEAKVIEMRRIYAAGGIIQAELAKHFGVSPGTVGCIVSRHTWKHLAP